MGEAVDNVDKDLSKLLSTFEKFRNHGESSLQSLIDQLQTLRDDLSNSMNENGDVQLTDLQRGILDENVYKKSKNITNQFSTEHRDMHAPVSRVGRSVDKNFIPDYTYSRDDIPFSKEGMNNVLNKAIMEHFLRQGRSSIAQLLMSEADLGDDAPDQAAYTQMNEILEALKNRDLNPALAWSAANREQLRTCNFEFQLHRLKFIQLLQSDCDACELIRYCQTYLSVYNEHFGEDIKTLMGAIAWRAQGIENSPYAEAMLDEHNWTDICQLFMKESCFLLGVSVESPLSLSFNAGCVALPALINIYQAIMHQQSGSEMRWSERDELPIEIEVSGRTPYHSVFACPILRQQATESNPPMRLTCGHVISRDALNKLSNGNKLKCPYCPVEQNPNDARQIHF